jgi:beta-phosphoglucomutase family hydrolase
MNSSNNQTRAVLWDLDGTLIDSMAYHWEAWNDALQPLGYHFSVESFAPTNGLRNEDILRDYLKIDRPPSDITAIVGAKEARYRSIMRERGLPLLPGAEHWLKALRAAGWRQAIVTSAPRLNVAAAIDATHLDRLVDTIVCAEDVLKGKPDPEPFLLAADRLGVDPAQCIVVEDAQAGLDGARRAGMKSIGILTAHTPVLAADRVVKALTDLAEDAFDEMTSGE